MKQKLLLLLLTIMIAFSSCTNSDTQSDPQTPTPSKAAALARRETPFNTPSPTLSPEPTAITPLTEKDILSIKYTTTTLNVRKGPGTDYDILTTLSPESEVKILSEEGNWSKIEFEKSDEGYAYVSTKYLTDNISTPASDTADLSATPSDKPTQNNDKNSSSTKTDSKNNNSSEVNEKPQTSVSYVLNTNTKKIHRPSCSSAKQIASKNYSTSNLSISELEAKGYSRCKRCLK